MMKMRGDAFVADNAVVLGRVEIGSDASVWYGVTIRGDDAPITIGARTNIQDNSVVHADPGKPHRIGEAVTIGHGAICHGIEIGDRALIGMGAIVLGGSVIGECAVVGAGCVVSENMEVPPYSLAVGVPARIVKTWDEKARREHAEALAQDYVDQAGRHLRGEWR